MRQVFEAFRLTFDQGHSQREIARALVLSQGTVNDYLRRFRATAVPHSAYSGGIAAISRIAMSR